MSSSMSRRAGGLLLTLIVSSAWSRVFAAEDVRVSGPAASAARAQATLDERETRARVWQYGWGAAGYGMAATLGTLAATTNDHDARIAFGLASGGIFIDTTIHMLSSIEPNAAARARDQPGQAMDQLRVAAEAETLRQSLLFGHLLPEGAATVGGLVLWLAFGNLEGAIVGTAAAVVTNELRILTQPTSARDAWNAYRQGQSRAEAPQRRAVRTSTWSLALTSTGFGVLGTF